MNSSRPHTDAYRTTGPSLRGHIVSYHLKPENLFFEGGPKYDIEVAQMRGFDLDWVMDKIFERLHHADDTLRRTIPLWLQPDFTTDELRTMLLQTICYMEHWGYEVPWQNLEATRPYEQQPVLDMGTFFPDGRATFADLEEALE